MKILFCLFIFGCGVETNTTVDVTNNVTIVFNAGTGNVGIGQDGAADGGTVDVDAGLIIEE